MAALPKKKHSKRRQGGRFQQYRMSRPRLTECSQCHRGHLPHRACRWCGYYNGREVVAREASGGL